MKKIFALIVFMMGLISCNDEEFFELTNPPEFPWKTMSELEMGVVTPYDYSFTHSDWGNYYCVDVLHWDVMSDVLFLLPGTSANWSFNEVTNRSTETRISEADGNFNNGYKAIGACNLVLDFLANNDNEPFVNMTDVDHENITRIKGEMHFMRAFTYFHMVRRHCPHPGDPKFKTEKILPVREKFSRDLNEAVKVKSTTGDSIYQIIMDDLLTARELLPEQFIDDVHHPSYEHGRATRYACAGILMRAYMMLNEYDKALEECNYIINSGKFSLDQDPIEAFNRSDPSKGNEVIWYAAYFDDVLGNSAKPGTLMTINDYRAINGGKGEYWNRCIWNLWPLSHWASQQMGWMDENLDITQEALRDKRYNQVYYRLEGNNGDKNADETVYEMNWTHITLPYIWGDKYFRAPDGQYSNVPVLRLAEVYLTRSILRYMNGDLEGAASDLNVVRKRAWDEEVAGAAFEASETFVTADNITEEMIHIERMKELTTEGDRLNYLQSLRLPIGPGDREGVDEIPYPYEDLYWKIPLKEIQLKPPPGE